MRRIIFAAAAAAMAASLATTGAAAAAPITKTEHFSFISTSITGNTFSAIATGAFTAGGTANLPSGKGTLKFPGGTIKVTNKAGRVKSSFDAKTCLATSVQPGTFKVISGTGAYAGITGSGKYTAHFTEVAPTVAGKCSTKGNPVAVQAIISASGPVTLP
jgi:hypothetical protein